MYKLICQYFIKRVVSPYFSVPAGEKSKQIGLIKPKLFEGETYNPDGDSFEKIKETVVNTYETVEDKFDALKDKIEDKFELQKDDD